MFKDIDFVLLLRKTKQIKSVLIQLYARPDDAVLDLACGKVIVSFCVHVSAYVS